MLFRSSSSGTLAIGPETLWLSDKTFSWRAGDDVRDDETSMEERRELGVVFVVVDILATPLVKNEPMPVPHPPRMGLVGSGGGGRFTDMLSGLSPLARGFVGVPAILSRD